MDIKYSVAKDSFTLTNVSPLVLRVISSALRDYEPATELPDVTRRLFEETAKQLRDKINKALTLTY